MTDKVIRWGILGAADFARNHMGPAIHAAHGAELVAVASSSDAKVDGFRAFAPHVAYHDSYDALLAAPDIDVVYVPLPNHLHVEWTKKALAAGKHVLTEKPIALQAAEIDDLIVARDKAGRLAAEAYMIVHHPQWQRARALLADGAVGDLVHVAAVFSYFNDDMANIRNRPETGGGGIRDIGVYTYGSVIHTTGETPLEVTHADIEWINQVDVTAHVGARFDRFTYRGTTSTRAAPFQEVGFYGTKGVLRLTTPFNANVFGQAQITLARPDMTTLEERFPGVNHYTRQVENFSASVRDGAPYGWTLEQARSTQAMIDAVFAKAGPPPA